MPLVAFILGNRRNPSSGQRELFEPQLSTKAQDERLLKWIVFVSRTLIRVRNAVACTKYTQIPMSVVEVASFKSFINGINQKYVLPCRKTVTRRIISTYSSKLQDMKSQLGSLDSKVSLTYGVWTSKANLPYASITIHYIDSDWKLHGYPLSFRYFPYPHAGQRHQELIMETIRAFGLENKILACVSDNDESTVQGLKSVKVILENEYGNSAFHPYGAPYIQCNFR
ncbi:hypothetical protein V1522DRAFT_254784 [Lipomyces starkeyi]